MKILDNGSGKPCFDGYGNRCVICGRYYKPDLRVGARQKTCSKPCSHQLDIDRDRKWRKTHPGYFTVESRTGVASKRSADPQVEIKPANSVKSASVDIGLRISILDGVPQVEINPRVRVKSAFAGAGAVFHGG